MNNDSPPAKVRLTDGLGPLVERLRTRPTGDPYLHMMVHEAADEIERLRVALSRIAQWTGERDYMRQLAWDALMPNVGAKRSDAAGGTSA